MLFINYYSVRKAIFAVKQKVQVHWYTLEHQLVCKFSMNVYFLFLCEADNTEIFFGKWYSHKLNDTVLLASGRKQKF